MRFQVIKSNEKGALSGPWRDIQAVVILGMLLSMRAVAAADHFELSTATIADIQQAMEAKALSAEKLTQLYLDRIAAYEKAGPTINSIISLNPKALEVARSLDAERQAGRVRGPLHGIPVVLKDCINTNDLPTTFGCQVYEGWVPAEDAEVVARLRQAGAIILAKVNLTEFTGGGGLFKPATIPSMPTGFSSAGGQTVNPYDLGRSPGSSSSGTGAALGAVFAQIGLGTDSAGSVRIPSAHNGLVGLKTTNGLLSRRGIAPNSLTLDVVGPMGRSVYDVAISLGVMTGIDPRDETTLTSDGKFERDYTLFLKRGALQGARIGVARDFPAKDPETERIFNEAIETLRKLGATVVDPVPFPEYVLRARVPLLVTIMVTEFHSQLSGFLQTVSDDYPRSIAEYIAKATDPAYPYRSLATALSMEYTSRFAMKLDDPVYLAARDQGIAMIRVGMSGVFEKYQLDAIVYPTSPGPAPPLRSATLSPRALPPETPPPTFHFPAFEASPSVIANEAGLPDLVVPAGMTAGGLPVSISILGLPFSEGKLLGYGFDFEQATKARKLPPNTPSLPGESFHY